MKLGFLVYFINKRYNKIIPIILGQGKKSRAAQTILDFARGEGIESTLQFRFGYRCAACELFLRMGLGNVELHVCSYRGPGG